MSVAIVMSVYHADRLLFLKESVSSLLSQTYKDITIFIAVDGCVTEDVQKYLEECLLIKNVEVFFYKKNLGLAFRLNQLIEKVVDSGRFDFIARMDADDVSAMSRIEKQVLFFSTYQSISVVGSELIEINEAGQELFYKKMSNKHEVLSRNIIKKCPFNHPSVMFRVSVFKEHPDLRYNSSLRNTQDYYLWVDMLERGLKFANINEPLLYFRVDDKFHSRRGLKKAFNDVQARIYAFNKLKCYSASNLVHVFLLFFLRLAPASVKKIAYKKFR